jgi:hypothetical protein
MRLDRNKRAWHADAMLDTLFAPPPLLADLENEEAAIVSATRRWVRARGSGCPLAAASAVLGSRSAASALHLVLATMGAAWPEPFAVAPPCCARLTHDEATLVAMVLASRRHTRPVFDALLCEMLDQDARDRLFGAAQELGRAVAL